MRFSVLIVTFNNESTIGDCLESLKRQSLQDFEILIRDNGSKDSTLEIIARYGEVRRFDSLNNEGFAAGMNRLAREAAGDYLFFLNPDCFCPEQTLQMLCDFAMSHDGVLAPALTGLDGKVQVSARNLPDFKNILFSRRSPFYALGLTNHEAAGYLDIRQPMKVPAVSATALVIKRQLFADLGGFDDRFFMYLEDIDLCHRLGQAKVDIWYLPDLRIKHAWGVSAKKAPLRSTYYHYISMFRYFSKYYPDSQVRLCLLFLLLAGGFGLSIVLGWLGMRPRK